MSLGKTVPIAFPDFNRFRFYILMAWVKDSRERLMVVFDVMSVFLKKVFQHAAINWNWQLIHDDFRA